MTYEYKTTEKEITNDQIAQLDELLASFENLNKCEGTKVNGDDALMIESVKNASNFVANEESSFLDSITHIKSSYYKAL